jgi:hypothetical protein
MDRILLVVAIALLYSSASLAADEGRAYDAFQFSLATYNEDGFDGAKPVIRVGQYGKLTNTNVAIEERSIDYSPAHNKSAPGKGIGLGVTPLFSTYGVYRTSSHPNNSTYLAVGFMSEELAMDEVDSSDSWDSSGFSYGFGVSNPSFNIEYMMSMDEGNYEISAIGLGLVSEF